MFILAFYASIGSNHWWWYAPCSICCCFQWSILGRSRFGCIDGYAINAWFMEQECWWRKAHGVSSSLFCVPPFFLPSSCMTILFYIYCCVLLSHWQYLCYVMHKIYSSELVQRAAINDIAESVMAFNTNYKDTGLFGVYAVAKVSAAIYLWVEVLHSILFLYESVVVLFLPCYYSSICMFSTHINFYQSSTQAVAVRFFGDNNVTGRMLTLNGKKTSNLHTVLSFSQNSFVQFEGPFFHVKIERLLFSFSILIIEAQA